MNSLTDGRAAFEKGAWSEAYRLLAAADADTPLEPEDLNRLARAAYLTGHDEANADALSRAHARFLERGQNVRAAAAALGLTFSMRERPAQQAQAAGWLSRAQRLLDEANEACVEQGWLRCATALQAVRNGEVTTAQDMFSQAAAIGDRFRDRDLVALARHGLGRTLLFLDKGTEAFALLDEVMISVTGGEVAPHITGVVYCSVISACHDVFDLRRAHEWTAALQRWCAAHADLVPFRGDCLVRRSEVMQLSGAWQDALDEARRACEWLAATSASEAGLAYYQWGELSRLRGDFTQAEEAYRLANQAGRKPYPGLALLRLAQGQAEAADTAIRVALREVQARRPRVHLLRAAVDIALERCDLVAARAAASELDAIARKVDAPFLRGAAAQAAAAVALAETRPAEALDQARRACDAWQELAAPYELARVRVLIGLAYRALDDAEGAELEFDAAHEVFDRIGAAPDAVRVSQLASPPVARSGGLTGREVEVLRLIATGATNRVIAQRLEISEKTVARHVSNIFTKLDLSSRAAATAYAYEHKLV